MHSRPRHIVFALLTLFILLSPRLHASAYDAKPKLVVVIVIDQFRGDYLEWAGGADHGSPYSYDTHVPLAFFGAPFKPGVYRTHAEPVDLAPTLSNLLGANRPSHAIGRVLTEALAPPASSNPPVEQQK